MDLLNYYQSDVILDQRGTIEKKMNYTIISNAVNLAARLEGVNKQYRTWVLASEDTIKETHENLLTRQLDRVRVVGINEPVRIHEVLETSADAPRGLHDKVQLFNKAHELFEKRKWNDAMIEFSRVIELDTEDMPALLYLDRCRQFLQYPPDNDWDGVFNFEEK